jgi:protein-S-isoprenylcysteine O-methyltransferase Ste14
MVVVVVPYGLLERGHLWDDGSPIVWLPRLAGIVLLALDSSCSAGASCCSRVGQRTLAPWDPTRRMVASGPYRFVRNPMISGVALMLIGEALFWGSSATAIWAAAFIAINHLYFVVLEEPGLESRFGDDYRVYRENVPRWFPRIRPWSGE